MSKHRVEAFMNIVKKLDGGVMTLDSLWRSGVSCVAARSTRWSFGIGDLPVHPIRNPSLPIYHRKTR